MTLQVGVIVVMASAVWMAQGTSQPLPPITDSDAYAIYGVLLDSLWRDKGDRPLLIVQETRLQPVCGSSSRFPQVWRTAQADMDRQNARTWKLLARFPTTIRYSLVPRAHIEADDARLSQKYPVAGITFQSRWSLRHFPPSPLTSTERKQWFTALYVMERTDGRWIVSSGGCRWIV